MADFDRTTYRPASAGTAAADIDAGLRAHFIKIYNYMFLAMGVSGAVAFLMVSSPSLMSTIWGSPLKWVAILAPLGIYLMAAFRINSMSFAAAQFWFWAYAAAVGVSLSIIFALFSPGSIVKVFMITGVTFAATSLYGYTTKSDLSKMSSFIIMGFIGMLLAILVNFFMQSPALHFAISCGVVLLFTVLTAWDTQEIKANYYAGDTSDVAGKKAVFGALLLYFNFVAIFKNLMFLMGEE